MNKFKVSIVRVENTIFEFEVNATNEDQAKELAFLVFGDCHDNGRVVFGEEFVHDIEKIKQ